MRRQPACAHARTRTNTCRPLHTIATCDTGMRAHSCTRARNARCPPSPPPFAVCIQLHSSSVLSSSHFFSPSSLRADLFGPGPVDASSFAINPTPAENPANVHTSRAVNTARRAACSVWRWGGRASAHSPRHINYYTHLHYTPQRRRPVS